VVPALDDAVAKGIKVVLIDNDLPDWDKKSSVVATDNKKGGELAGQYLAKTLKKGATVAVLEGVPGVPALDDRVTGMKDGLGSSGIKVVGKAPTDCDQDKGVSAAADLLTAHPDVDAIYGACGPPTVGAIQSIARAGRKPDSLLLVGFDALPDEIKMIQAGKEDASVAQFPAKMGELGMDTLLKAVKGEDAPPNVDTGTEVVTKANASMFGLLSIQPTLPPRAQRHGPAAPPSAPPRTTRTQEGQPCLPLTRPRRRTRSSTPVPPVRRSSSSTSSTSGSRPPGSSTAPTP
jgi:simple sugar transport system substrate-binding protein